MLGLHSIHNKPLFAVAVSKSGKRFGLLSEFLLSSFRLQIMPFIEGHGANEITGIPRMCSLS